jgi:hypothetical protein
MTTWSSVVASARCPDGVSGRREASAVLIGKAALGL